MDYSEHARQSMGNRAVREADVDYVLDHGVSFAQRDGREVYWCGKDCERPSCRNLAVVVGNRCTVITAVRTTNPKRLRLNAARGKSIHVST